MATTYYSKIKEQNNNQTPINMKHVLWFDDNKFEAFEADAYDENIDITQAPTLQRGLDLLKQNDVHYDLMLFDANYVTRYGQASSMMLTNTIHKCCEAAGKDVPWLVFTAGAGFDGADSLDNAIPTMPWHEDLALPLWYSKQKRSDAAQLLIDIHKVIDYMDSPYRQIKNKYPDIFKLFHPDYGSILDKKNEKDIVDLIQILEDPSEHNQASHLTTVRAFLEGPLTESLVHYKIVAPNLSLNEVNYQFKNWDLQEMGVHHYIQISFDYMVRCTQDASHSGKHVTKDKLPPQVRAGIQSGTMPYLVPNIIHTLLSFLTWYLDFIQQQNSTFAHNQ